MLTAHSVNCRIHLAHHSRLWLLSDASLPLGLLGKFDEQRQLIWLVWLKAILAPIQGLIILDYTTWTYLSVTTPFIITSIPWNIRGLFAISNQANDPLLICYVRCPLRFRLEALAGDAMSLFSGAEGLTFFGCGFSLYLDAEI